MTKKHLVPFVVVKTRKWTECDLTCGDSQCTVSDDRTTMREDTKLARVGDTWRLGHDFVEQERVDETRAFNLLLVARFAGH